MINWSEGIRELGLELLVRSGASGRGISLWCLGSSEIANPFLLGRRGVKSRGLCSLGRRNSHQIQIELLNLYPFDHGLIAPYSILRAFVEVDNLDLSNLLIGQGFWRLVPKEVRGQKFNHWSIHNEQGSEHTGYVEVSAKLRATSTHIQKKPFPSPVPAGGKQPINQHILDLRMSRNIIQPRLALHDLQPVDMMPDIYQRDLSEKVPPHH